MEKLFTITFRNAGDVVEFDEHCEVPLHEERESLDMELFMLGRYLRALAAAGSLIYPLTVVHAEQSKSPDFTLSTPAGPDIGLEMTEATTSHKLFIKSEKSEVPIVIWEPESNDDEAQQQTWAAVVFARVRTKAAGLASGRWTPADSYDLVIYEHGSTNVAVDLSKALSILRALLDAQPRSGFRTVSIIADSFTRLIYLEGDSRTLSIPSKRA